MNELVIDAAKDVVKEVVHLDFSTMNWPGAVVLSVGLIAGAYAFDSYMKYGHMNMHMPARKIHNAEFTRKYQTQLS